MLARFGVDPGSAPAFVRLLDALAAEPDPPTTVRDPAAALDAHLADSLSGLEVTELRSASRIADLGSGPGFPGVALAVALPQARVDLVEASARKVDVAGRLAAAAGATGARPVRARAEEWALAEGQVYDAVTARALAPLGVVYEYAAPLLRPDGVVVAWKGRRDVQEEARAARAAAALGLEPEPALEVTPFPGAHSRHLHVARKMEATPSRFPRRPGVAVKRPLGG